MVEKGLIVRKANGDEEKRLLKTNQPLNSMFIAVPPQYDLINHVITLGMDNHWRRLAAKVCLEGKLLRILDLGCGTGDLTINLARLAKENVEIVGVDYSPPMLERAREKAYRNAEKLSFIDHRNNGNNCLRFRKTIGL